MRVDVNIERPMDLYTGIQVVIRRHVCMDAGVLLLRVKANKSPLT